MKNLPSEPGDADWDALFADYRPVALPEDLSGHVLIGICISQTRARLLSGALAGLLFFSAVALLSTLILRWQPSPARALRAVTNLPVIITDYVQLLKPALSALRHLQEWTAGMLPLLAGAAPLGAILLAAAMLLLGLLACLHLHSNAHQS
jgi:hypothetical protein